MGISTVNFIGGSITATSTDAGTAIITVTAASNVTVTQTGYTCTPVPITVTDGSQINISSSSNAYGTRYIQSTAPASACDGDIWYDTSSGSTNGNPVGTVIYYANTSAPPGYIKANGAANLNTYTYKDLHKAISNTFGGTAYSAGVTDISSATTVFTIPDLRGEFIRGWVDNRTGVDTQTTFGRFQADDFKSHTHPLPQQSIDSGGGSSSPQLTSTYSSTRQSTGSAPTTGGTETRPRNIALLACIKYI